MKNNNFITINSLLLIATCFLSPSALSEVTLDGSMGTTASLSGPDYQITENLGQRAGNNLFHSFGKFNLNSAESATFSGSAGIKNVISRVTGGQASMIDGAFRSTIPGANVYFLNPSGVIFGENASLDVQGSFHASTADYLKFKDGVKFTTGLANPNPILTTASPEAFGFLDKTPAPITVSGGHNKILKVPENATLSLIGGDIDINDRSLYAPSGQIILASTGSTGEIVINQSGVNTSSFSKGGTIHLNHAADNPVTTINNDINIADIDVSADSAGKVVIRGGQMVMDNAHISAITNNSNGGDIDIGLAGDLTMNGIAETSNLKNSSRSSGITAYTRGKGNTGTISIDANTIKIHNNAGVFNLTSNDSTGNSGDITLNATHFINLTENAFIGNNTSGKGQGGNININTESIKMNDATINSSTQGEGNGGNLSIKANALDAFDSHITASSDKTATGNHGSIKVEANSILLSGDSSDTSSSIENSARGNQNTGDLSVIADKLVIKDWAKISTFSNGSGSTGKLLVAAKEIVLANKTNHPTKTLNGIFSSLGFHSTGNSEGLTVKTQNLAIHQGSIKAVNAGSGDGGNLTIEAINSILLNATDSNGEAITGAQSSINTQNFSTGKAGELNISARNIHMQNKAEISTATTGSANAGNLTIKADHLKMRNIGLINTGTQGIGDGGDLFLDIGQIELADSLISSLTLGKENGNAGDITIHASKIILREDSSISAATDTRGRGGDVTINVDNLILNSGYIANNSTFVDFDSISNPDTSKSGNITITANQLIRLENNSGISTMTDKANAGSIEIKGEGNLLIRGESGILALVDDGKGKGGDISINSPIVSMDNNKSRINAQAVEGAGGNITLSGFLFQSPLSFVTASSKLSVDGQLNLKPETNISGSITTLPESLLNASQHLNDHCSSRSGENTNSFVIKNGGIPLSPRELIPSNIIDSLPTEKNHASLSLENTSNLNNKKQLSFNNISCKR